MVAGRVTGRALRFGILPTLILAGAAAAAAPLREIPSDSRRDVYRALAFAVCLEANPFIDEEGRLNGDAARQCDCAVDRLMEGRGLAELPRLDRGTTDALLEPHLAACRGGSQRPQKVAPPTAPAADDSGRDPGPVQDKPPGPAATETDRPAASLPSWPAGIRIPGWIWAAIPAAFILLVLALALARHGARLKRGGRGDLLGPPPSMRSGPPPGRRPPF